MLTEGPLPMKLGMLEHHCETRKDCDCESFERMAWHSNDEDVDSDPLTSAFCVSSLVDVLNLLRSSIPRMATLSVSGSAIALQCSLKLHQHRRLSHRSHRYLGSFLPLQYPFHFLLRIVAQIHSGTTCSISSRLSALLSPRYTSQRIVRHSGRQSLIFGITIIGPLIRLRDCFRLINVVSH
ncbi:hypothetical protein SISSUDRAFT_441971 [Sistotremastrum suecicum HHB10207 ss-3]|uniref:Uncharacterized protein n=1 Tax=Sistotremastrum suecicum HHB10207 ss-3 TaxID=1314776 RepID=A0A165YDK1_9AGAM|nr:hypothetical protein SISSUDRAFT_441971 [Sistotremastrum suecicum HHB10207 ss-3]